MIVAPKCRWYQFSLRTLLLLVTALCIGPGGYVTYERRRARRQKATVEAILKSGGRVFYGVIDHPRSAWARQVLGDETFGSVIGAESHFASTLTDAGLVRISDLPQLKVLSFENARVTDADLAHVGELKRLEMLFLNNTLVTDAGMTHLVGCKRLKYLTLSDTQVTGAGMDVIHKASPRCGISR